jgi:hypothetical protein
MVLNQGGPPQLLGTKDEGSHGDRGLGWVGGAAQGDNLFGVLDCQRLLAWRPFTRSGSSSSASAIRELMVN